MVLSTAEREAVAAPSGQPASSSSRRGRHTLLRVAEIAGVLLLPLAAYLVLHLRLMPVPDLNDPAMHSTYIFDPRAFFDRYTAVLDPTSRLREGARAGFLVPARTSYLLFGAVPGFIVFRYLLALIAVAPAYLLSRRLAGPAAGVLTALLVLSSPVIVTAWGTDFPDSAVVSYLIGGMACIAMPARHRRRWLAAGALLFTMAIWAFASSAVLIGAFGLVYLALRRLRDRDHLIRDLGLMAAVFAATTLALAVGSWLLSGEFDFVRPTIRSLIFLSHHSEVVQWHSSSWAWAPYDTYLLVLPAVALAWLGVNARRLRRLDTPQLLIGLGFTAQLVLGAVLEFFGNLQDLEIHYFSSTFWAGATLTLALALVAAGARLEGRWRWLLPAVALAVPLIYVIVHPAIPAFGWLPAGLPLAALAVVALLGAALLAWRGGLLLNRVAVPVLAAINLGALLVLTVAPLPGHPQLPGVIGGPPPAYADALGGSSRPGTDIYQVVSELPGFAGPPAYRGEQLVQWWPYPPWKPEMLAPIGIFHAYFNSFPCPVGGPLTPACADFLEQRRPAQVLLMSTSGDGFDTAASELAPYGARVEKRAVLSSGDYTLHVWLIELTRYLRPASA